MARLALASVLLALVPLVLVGCVAGGKAGGEPPSMALLAGDWTVRTIMGKDVSAMLPEAGRVPYVTITSEGQFGGFSGVNRVASRLDVPAIARGEFRLAPVMMTKMAGPPEAMAVERRFAEALGKVSAFTIDGEMLRLSDGRSDVMTLVRGLPDHAR